jgi:hypothetical protein
MNMIKNYLSYAVAAAFFVASGIGNVAFAQTEVEAAGTAGANDELAKAQHLEFTDNKIQVTGVIGHLPILPRLTAIRDIDFYSFDAKKGESVRVDIDGGMKNSTTLRSLDSMIGIFTSDGTLLRTKNDLVNGDILDTPESLTTADPWMNDVFLPSTGRYIVGVTSDANFGTLGMRVFVPGGTTSGPEGTGDGFKPTAVANGRYTLVIERTPAKTIPIAIEVRPNAKSITTHAHSSGKIPVMLKTSEEFNALEADRASITFGRVGRLEGTGAKGHCNKHGVDLLCHFEKRDAGFHEDDSEGMVSGKIDGKDFEGIGWSKVIPVNKDKKD